MNDQQIDDREIVVLHGRAVEDTAAIADILAKKLAIELFNFDGRLLRIEDGRLVNITNPLLAELIGQLVMTVRPVFDGENWSAELCNLSLDRQQLTAVANKLLLLVAQGKGQVKQLSDQIKSNIKARARCGEPPIAIAKYYQIGIDEVNRITAAA